MWVPRVTEHLHSSSLCCCLRVSVCPQMSRARPTRTRKPSEKIVLNAQAPVPRRPSKPHRLGKNASAAQSPVAPMEQEEEEGGEKEEEDYFPEWILQLRTVRKCREALVRWKTGWTADERRPDIHAVLERGADGQVRVQWKDSWEPFDQVSWVPVRTPTPSVPAQPTAGGAASPARTPRPSKRRAPPPASPESLSCRPPRSEAGTKRKLREVPHTP
jgi:hypothetical protein